MQLLSIQITIVLNTEINPGSHLGIRVAINFLLFCQKSPEIDKENLIPSDDDRINKEVSMHACIVYQKNIIRDRCTRIRASHAFDKCTVLHMMDMLLKI